MSRKKTYRILIVFLILIIFFAFYKKNNDERSVFEYSSDIFVPYYIEDQGYLLDDEGRNKKDFQENGKDYINYWIQAASMVSALNDKENEITPGILQCMENIRDTFHRNGKFPRPEYKQFSYGWVSSMDAPVIMLASQMLYEKTNDLKWKEFVDELVEYIVLPVEKGGYNLYYSTKKGEKAVWPLEYADKNSTEINSQFVLNGSLTGYLSTKIVADIRRDKILLDYCEKVKLAYKDKFTEFHYEKYPWTYYMLNPKKVIPPHYIIFEVELLSAISKIDQDKIFEEELNFRRDALKSVLGLQFRESGEGIEWIIRRACAPHPYLIDIYASKIVFYDKKNKVLSSYENDISGSLAENRNRFSEGEWIQGGGYLKTL